MFGCWYYTIEEYVEYLAYDIRPAVLEDSSYQEILAVELDNENFAAHISSAYHIFRMNDHSLRLIVTTYD